MIDEKLILKLSQRTKLTISQIKAIIVFHTKHKKSFSEVGKKLNIPKASVAWIFKQYENMRLGIKKQKKQKNFEENTCSVELKIDVDANTKSAKILVKTIIDGEEVFVHKDNNFMGFHKDIEEFISQATKPIEQDGRFGS